MGREAHTGGAYVYIQLIHYVVQQKLTHCKASVSFIYTLIKKIKIQKLNTFFFKVVHPVLFYLSLESSHPSK